MKINNEHLYHGAALNQIAEDPHFTAINAFKTNGQISRSAFKINDSVGVYLKYCTEPKGRYDEYKFTFQAEHLIELKRLAGVCDRVFLALVCVKDGQICCVPYETFMTLIEERRAVRGEEEDQYQLLAVLPARSEFRVYVNEPGVKKTSLTQIKIPRKDFPAALFA